MCVSLKFEAEGCKVRQKWEWKRPGHRKGQGLRPAGREGEAFKPCLLTCRVVGAIKFILSVKQSSIISNDLLRPTGI